MVQTDTMIRNHTPTEHVLQLKTSDNQQHQEHRQLQPQSQHRFAPFACFLIQIINLQIIKRHAQNLLLKL